VTTAYSIRRAGPEDAETLAELGRATFLETFVEGFGIPYPPQDLEAFMAHSYSAGYNAPRLVDPEQAVWFGEADGRPVAYAGAGPAKLPHPDIRPGDGELQALYVAREAQGSGLGRALMETALEWLERDGPRTLWIGVWSENFRAQRFYARYGFEKAGEYDFSVGRWRDREFILRRVAGSHRGAAPSAP
jgi:diamine N-acetyltransferase